jgi:exopolysaccharide production protein ExoZ
MNCYAWGGKSPASTGRNSGSKTITGIQVGRAVAALMVVFHHALEASREASSPPNSPDWLTTFGASGVDIFFVISGFIMLYVSFPTGTSPSKPVAFLVHRATRIYPFYWACLALEIALWSIGLAWAPPPTAMTTLHSALLLPNDQFIIGVAWTLVYEMYFYAVFSITLLWRSPLCSVLSSTFLIMALHALAGFAPGQALRSFLGDSIAFEFCFGLALAYLFQFWPAKLERARHLWILGIFLLAFAPMIVPHQSTMGLPDPARVTDWGLPSLLVVASLLMMKPPVGRLSTLMVLLGDGSYAIYLTHPLLMDTYKRLTHGPLGHFPQWPIIPAVVAASIGVGLLAHLLVERPLVRLTRRLTHPGS